MNINQNCWLHATSTSQLGGRGGGLPRAARRSESSIACRAETSPRLLECLDPPAALIRLRLDLPRHMRAARGLPSGPPPSPPTTPAWDVCTRAKVYTGDPGQPSYVTAPEKPVAGVRLPWAEAAGWTAPSCLDQSLLSDGPGGTALYQEGGAHCDADEGGTVPPCWALTLAESRPFPLARPQAPGHHALRLLPLASNTKAELGPRAARAAGASVARGFKNSLGAA